MKTSYFLFFALLALYIKTSAQVAVAPVLGANLSGYTWRSLNPTAKSTPSLGMRGGVMADIHLSGIFYLQPALLYVQNGGKFRYSFSPIESDPGLGADYRINTLQLPVNVSVKLGREGGNHIVISAGPYLAINMRATATLYDLQGLSYYPSYGSFGGGTVVAHDEKLTIANDDRYDVRRRDLGLNATVGYELKNGLFIQLAAQKGFTDQTPSGWHLNTINSKNYNASASVGYLIRGKKKGRQQ